MEPRKIRVFIAEDSAVAQVALRHLLGQYQEFEVIGTAGDGASAIQGVIELKPDVVIMDIGLPGMSGVDATRRIRQEAPESRVVMLTVHDNDASVFQALAAGAHGYCLKSLSGEQLWRAIHTVFDGGAWLDPKIASRVLRACTAPAPGGEEQKPERTVSLSARELDVLRLVVDGLTNQEIAEKLFISMETVKSHLKHIMDKLAVSDRTQAAVKAVREKLV